MRDLLLTLFLLMPFTMNAQDDVPVKTKVVKSSCGMRTDISISAGVAIPFIRWEYSTDRKARPGDALSLSADFVFNKAQRRFYGLASVRVGIFNFASKGLYTFKAMQQGRLVTHQSYDDEHMFGSMVGVSGGVGYKTGRWHTVLKTGIMRGIDMSGNTQNHFGSYSELSENVRIRPNASLGLAVFYTNTWLRPTGQMYQLHTQDTYNLISVAVQLKLRLPCSGGKKAK